jgi:hypothetical protein
MDNSSKMCIFFYPRATQVNQCVNENQYYGNVLLLWLGTCSFLIAYVVFTLEVLMYPVVLLPYRNVCMYWAVVCARLGPCIKYHTE